MIYGKNRPYNICIIIPDFQVLARYAKENGLPTDPVELIKTRQVHDLIAGEVNNALKGKYGRYEIPKKIMLLSENFSVDDGTLTQTLKVKRRVVLKRFKDEIDALYKAR